MTTYTKKDLDRIEALLNDPSYHIEFNGFLTNHAKQGVVALIGLGATAQRIQEFYDHYAQCTTYGVGLEPPKVSKNKITHDNWQDYFGRHCNFTAYCEFFDQQEKELGLERVLAEYVPTLLPGCVGSLMHGTIHLGWGLDSGNRWMTIEGLAYMAFSYISCQPDKTFWSTQGAETHTSVLESLLPIAEAWEKESEALKAWQKETLNSEQYSAASGFHPELSFTGFQNDVAKVLTEGHPLIHTTPAWIENLDRDTVWKELYEGITLLYLAKPGDFLTLHLVTSLYGMEQIVKRLPRDQQKRAIKCYWTAMLGVIFADEEIPTKTQLEALHSKYKDAVDPEEGNSEENLCEETLWKDTVDRAILQEEEHNPKLVYVQRLLWRRFGHRSLFRVAAEHFTTTPEVRKIDPEMIAGLNLPC